MTTALVLTATYVGVSLKIKIEEGVSLYNTKFYNNPIISSYTIS